VRGVRYAADEWKLAREASKTTGCRIVRMARGPTKKELLADVEFWRFAHRNTEEQSRRFQLESESLAGILAHLKTDLITRTSELHASEAARIALHARVRVLESAQRPQLLDPSKAEHHG
jgi:hypothetical protein